MHHRVERRDVCPRTDVFFPPLVVVGTVLEVVPGGIVTILGCDVFTLGGEVWKGGVGMLVIVSTVATLGDGGKPDGGDRMGTCCTTVWLVNMVASC